MKQTKRFVLIPSRSPVWSIDTEYITNWVEAEKKGILSLGKFGELGRSGLYQVYKGNGIMKYADDKEEAKRLSEQFIADDKHFRKLEKEYLKAGKKVRA